MFAKSRAIWRGLQQLLRTLGSSRLGPALTDATHTSNVRPTIESATLKYYATIEIIEAPEPPDGGTPAALPLPILAQTSALATMYRSASIRPLASQMAVTAQRNVPRGRKPHSTTKPRNSAKSAMPRVATCIKAKPVVMLAKKKKAPKRRHVWLSTQSRVIRSVTGNVVQFNTQRAQRTSARQMICKTPLRPFKLAA